MQVMEFYGRCNREEISKQWNLTVKMTVKIGMPKGLNKRCCTFFLSLFINAQPSAAAQRTAMHLGMGTWTSLTAIACGILAICQTCMKTITVKFHYLQIQHPTETCNLPQQSCVTYLLITHKLCPETTNHFMEQLQILISPHRHRYKA